MKCANGLTTFLLPTGKYRYKRGPMGLSSTGDCWCQRSDEAICGVPDCSKIVDDILAAAKTIDDLFHRLRAILQNCRRLGLTISKKKFCISRSLPFAGYAVSQEGVKPDPDRVKAISQFPRPTDVSSVRSFLGLANQLGHFIADLAIATTNLRGLLKKGIKFQWLAEHEEEFIAIKKLLTSSMLVKFYDPALPTSILTDASSVNGIGFVLIQHEEDGKTRLIQAGSRSLTDTEKRYAPIEQECLGAVWGIERCRHFLYGCPNFRLVTDHLPLIGTFRKDLIELENRRLQRMRERVIDYSFNIEWIEGKSHLMADAMSRNIAKEQEEQEDGIHIASVLHSLDLSTLTMQFSFIRQTEFLCPSQQGSTYCN